ncbi:alkaline phosphatase D family protein [Marilutibacter chinensis]|uniref:Alkaline phosphatase D family protein n=1 Tax=Marilutibacter chinensis TaxID=2912247 RepID=A0ABS9HTM0_9GAMM|nr:alkaline phosphatase D family protein [Lysobacter chinensis]MCF7222254.1 alkaline phosphatase D family protein [Lysobacter chinensis]
MTVDLQRRRLLKALTITASALPFASLWPVAAANAGEAERLRRFPQSVASGDPRPDAVMLWTRAPAGNGEAVVLRLQVALDAGFEELLAERELRAEAVSDHCVRVRLRGLAPGTHYHYRFLCETGQGWIASPHGRTRTAPAADSSEPVSFAVLSCQDYGGRWYNSLLPLLDGTLLDGMLPEGMPAPPRPDFILHLGDFIYESVGDPSFQTLGDERRIALDDTAGAIVRGGSHGYLAACSLDNYRQIHRTVRTDPVLQQLLASTPLVAIWDDHEFSDDCWQDRGTYSDGLDDERAGARRVNAEQAYFEYMPVDIDVGPEDAAGQQSVDTARLFPHTRMWRELRFGRNLQLLLVDYRSHRPDHLIPEDAFPGALAYDEPALRRLLPRIGGNFDDLGAQLLPYVDAGHPQWPRWRKALRRALLKAYRDEGLDPAASRRRVAAIIDAPIAVVALNGILQRYNAAVPGFMEVPLAEVDESLPRGLPWIALGKTALFKDIGSRYFVVKDSYDLLAALRAAEGQASALGDAQTAWLAERIAASDARWKLVASSVSMTSMVLDLTRPELQAPELYRRRFYLNVDQWDGFPVERRRLVDEVFEPAGGVVVLSGDIHAGFATQLAARTIEFTVPAVSSQTLNAIMAGSVESDPDAGSAEAGRRLVAALDALLPLGNEAIRYAQTVRHGHGLVTVADDGLRAGFFELPPDLCATCLYPQPREALAQGRWVRFEVDSRTRRLRRV